MSDQIETERLVLRWWWPADAEAALAVYADPAVMPWLTPEHVPASTVDGMRTRIRAWREEDSARGGSAGHWAVATKDGGIVGGLALYYVPVHGENLTLAWALAPGAWGRGYATEAGSALIRWAIHEEGVHDVFAILQRDNERAVATARRMGMDWVTDLGGRRYDVYRVRHGDVVPAD